MDVEEKKINLHAFGCSFTFGQNLEDNNGSVTKTSKFAWPEKLKDLLGYKSCINYAKCGASNKRIAYTVLESIKNISPDSDIVFINWTLPDRFCVIHENNIEDLAVWNDNINSVAWKNHLHDFYDTNIDLNTNMLLTYLFLTNLNIKNYHTITRREWFKKTSWNITETFLNSYMEEYWSKYPFALDGGHPGSLAHENFAIGIFNDLKEKNET